MSENIILNSTVVPTWRHLKVNEYKLDDFNIPKIEKYNKDFLSYNEEDFKDVLILTRKDADKIDEKFLNHINKEKYGVSEKLVKLAEKQYNSGIFVHVPKFKETKSYIKLSFKLDENNKTLVDNNIIIAEQGSKITLVFDYSSNSDAAGFHNGLTKVFAGDNSEVTIIKVQRMNDKAVHFDSNAAFVSEGAKVNWITAEMGSTINVTNYTSNLNGDLSGADIYSAYFVDGDRKQDLYYTANHIGKSSQSNMVIKGVLKDRSKKLFKGNIDFKKGSSKSKGKQEESVLLLDPGVKTDSVPMLLCQEEDVDGAHAASVGRIDEEKLFYLMSRGFPIDEAKRLIVEAEFNPIFDKIADEDLKKLLKAEVKRRLSNE